ncbi:MAG: type 2 isopentenyl-diphosphate Delta-isomerase [Lactobacillaceae bacterium]|jgi:isopentenyl-diphosphate delta-isomerase|nr:type 2 isopentenyl-diphosphate Delta-isomerase [Lactobacillaceae bacterium]
MELTHAHRKDEHLAVAELEYRKHAPASSLEQMRVLHNALPNLAVSDVDLSVHDANFPLTTPFYIEAMTGGSQKTGIINQQLAQVASETGLAMAVGSQSIALTHPEAIETFTIARKTNPNGFIMANIGAGHTAKEAQLVVNMLEANALEVHINVMQELVMAEGDRNFKWADSLAEIINTVNVPVIIKEVGFGMYKETIAQLQQLGAQYINIGGRSGTNFAVIEDRRNRTDEADHSYLYDWGQTTAEALLEARAVPNAPTIFATGGIHSPLDVLKAQILGAKAVGVAGHFLHTVMQNDVAGLITEVTQWQTDLAKLYTAVGAKQQSELLQVPYVLSPELHSYVTQRGLQNN